MFNTGNPVPSTSLRDLSDNAEVFDKFMSSSVNQVVDRTGRSIYTVWFFSQLAATASAQIGATVTAAQNQVNTARDSGIAAIGVSVQVVDDAEAAAVLAMNEQVDSLSDDLGYKGFDTYAQMLAYVPRYNGVLAWVRNDPDPSKIGFYQWDAATTTWLKPYPQPALSTDVDALRRDVSLKKRPRGPVSGNAPLTFSAAGAQILFGTLQKRPRGPSLTNGTTPLVGSTPLLPMVTLKRPRGPTFTAQVLVLSGQSVMLTSEGTVTPVAPTVTYDAKMIDDQGQAPAPKRLALIVANQVWAYDGAGPVQITTTGTWLAAQVAAFDIVRALRSNTSTTPNPHQPHTIMRDGRVFRDGKVLWHKLVTGQSLALGSRGIVPDPTGEYVIGGVRGNLFSPITPVGYADKLWTLAGGPRPANWEGTTAFEPVREYVAGVLGETPATSYMLAMRKWHERNTSLAPQMLYSVSAVGGTAYVGLKKGTAPYTNAISQVNTAKSIATTMQLDYVVPSLSIVHGESQSNTTQAEYVAMMAEWISDYRTDIVAITGQAVAPVAYISQMLTGDPGTIPAIPLAQLQAHNENPNVIMIGPKYQFPYFDTYHMLAEGYVKMGEMEARAERLTQAVSKWQPLRVLSATVSGAVITLTLNNLPNGNAATPGPIGRLVADPVLVSDPGNFGFALSAGAISNVIVGRDGASITITTTATIAAGTVLTYALQPSLSAPQNGNGRRGCIRDTDMRDFSRFDAKPLYNWLCGFSLTLGV